ncbi:MAG: hypothetical protein WDZ51_07195 [Pirellulaceae bacterium]
MATADYGDNLTTRKPQRPKESGWFAWHPAWVWVANLLLLLGCAVWVVADARFDSAWQRFALDTGLADDPNRLDDFAGRSELRTRLGGIWVLGAGLVASMLVVWCGIFLGSRGHRSLLAWMVAMSLTAAWLAFFTGVEDLRWLGHRLRLGSYVESYEPIAELLKQDWPREDGEHQQLGPYMAYPAESPAMLLMLAPPEMLPTGTTISSVERSPAGGLRFQLSGPERGIWLEWHPEPHQPESFVGGLQDARTLDRFLEIGGDWYLARYEQSEMAR